MIHKCEFYIGRISDVVVRNSDNKIRCKKCLRPLRLSEIDKKMLKRLKQEGYFKHNLYNTKHKHLKTNENTK